MRAEQGGGSLSPQEELEARTNAEFDYLNQKVERDNAAREKNLNSAAQAAVNKAIAAAKDQFGEPAISPKEAVNRYETIKNQFGEGAASIYMTGIAEPLAAAIREKYKVQPGETPQTTRRPAARPQPKSQVPKVGDTSRLKDGSYTYGGLS